VPAIADYADHLRESPIVIHLSRSQRMFIEELDNLGQVHDAANPELHPITVVHADRSAAKE